MYDILPDLEKWFNKDIPVCLATVVDTWGSAPRGVGAKMAFTLEAEITGSVSGGCVETAVIESGIQAVKKGCPKLLEFGVSDESAFEVGLACGGKIEIFVRKFEPELFQAIKEGIQANKPLAIITVIAGPKDLLGREMVVVDAEKVWGEVSNDLDDQAIHLARLAIEADQSQRLTLDTPSNIPVQLFADVVSTPPVLIMVGGVHIAIALSQLAKTLGFQTIVIDPRRVFGTPERFPHIDRLILAWPDEAFAKLHLTRNTCVVFLTHDPKIDDPGLEIALNSPVFYVGALGSQKTNEKRRQRLLESGLTEAQLNRLHAPIGLDLGSRTPEEIALAILAEILAVRRGRIQ